MRYGTLKFASDRTEIKIYASYIRTDLRLQCTTFIKHIYFVHTFHIYQSITDYLYVQCIDYIYTKHVCCILCVKCVYSVFAIHYKYIIEVLGKTIRRTGMIDHSFERKFHGACYRPSFTIFCRLIANKIHNNSKT